MGAIGDAYREVITPKVPGEHYLGPDSEEPTGEVQQQGVIGEAYRKAVSGVSPKADTGLEWKDTPGPLKPHPYGALVDQYAEKYAPGDTDFRRVVRGMLRTESSAENPMQPGVVTKSGERARGPMQVMPGTFGEVMPGGDINNPNHLVRAGVAYAHQLWEKYGHDPAKTSAAYFTGPGNVDPDAPNIPRYTRGYADSVRQRGSGTTTPGAQPKPPGTIATAVRQVIGAPAAEMPSGKYGLREDGTQKGEGYFGPLPRIDNPKKVSTELSAGIEIDGKETQVPLMVPTLSADELKFLLSSKPKDFNRSNPMAASIRDKAEDFARQRLANGLSVWAAPGERYPLPGSQEAAGAAPEPSGSPTTGTPQDQLTSARNQAAARDYLKQQLTPLGVGEATLEAVTDLFASAPAALSGMMAAIGAKDQNAFAQAFADAKENWVQHARTQEGKYASGQYQKALSLLDDFGSWMAETYMGAPTVDPETGVDIGPSNPVVATALRTIPQAIAMLLGLKKARGEAPKLEPGKITRDEAGVPTVEAPAVTVPGGRAPYVQGLRTGEVAEVPGETRLQGGPVEPTDAPAPDVLRGAIERRTAELAGGRKMGAEPVTPPFSGRTEPTVGELPEAPRAEFPPIKTDEMLPPEERAEPVIIPLEERLARSRAIYEQDIGEAKLMRDETAQVAAVRRAADAWVKRDAILKRDYREGARGKTEPPFGDLNYDPYEERNVEMAAPRGLESVDQSREIDTGRPEVPHVPAITVLRGIDKDFREGLISDAEYRIQTQTLLERMEEARDTARLNAASRARVRGPEWVEERLLRAQRLQELPEGAAELGLWFLRKNPAVATNLGISLKGEMRAAGSYNPGSKIVTLAKGHGASDVVAHEILHHTEPMLPNPIRQRIRTEWAEKLSDEIAAAEKSGNTRRQRALQEVVNALEGDRTAQKLVGQLFEKGVLDKNRDYQLVNPSEYWAVNASRILNRRFLADSWIDKAKQWLTEFAQKLKGVLGLRSDAPVLRGLKEVMRTEGEIKGDMLHTGQGSGSMFNAPPRGAAAAAPPRKSMFDKALDAVFGEKGKYVTLFRPLTRDYQVGLHDWHVAGSQAGRELRKIVPKEARRNAISEAIVRGDLSVLSPEERRVAQQGMAVVRKLGELGLDTGTLKELRDKYVTQIWDLKDKRTKAIINEWQRQQGKPEIDAGGLLGRLLDRSGAGRSNRAAARAIEDVFEGMKLGLKPATMDYAKIVESYVKEMASRVLKDKARKDLATLTAPDGTPMAMGIGEKKVMLGGREFVPRTVPQELAAAAFRAADGDVAAATRSLATRMMVSKNDISVAQHFLNQTLRAATVMEAPRNYVKINNAGIDNLRVHPDIAPEARVMLRSDEPTDFGRAAEAVSYLAKRSGTGFSLFHPVSLVQVFLQSGGINFVSAIKRGVKAMREGDPLVREGVGVGGLRIGVPLEDINSRDTYLKILDTTADLANKIGINTPKGKVGLGTPVKMLAATDRANQKLVWEYVHTGLKVETYLRFLDSNLAANAKRRVPMSRSSVVEQTAKTVNAMYGGLNWERFMEYWERPATRKRMAQILDTSGRRYINTWGAFAPDWMVSSVSTWAKAASTNPATRRMALRYLALGAVYTTIFGNLLNHQQTGHWMFENQPGNPEPTWRDKIKARTQVELKNGQHMNISKHFLEGLHFILDPAGFFVNKLPAIPSELLAQIEGKEYGVVPGRQTDRYPPDIGNRWLHPLKKFVPFSATSPYGAAGLPVYGKTPAEKELENEAYREKQKKMFEEMRKHKSGGRFY